MSIAAATTLNPAVGSTRSPVETFDAYRDHGDPKARLEQDVERAGLGFGAIVGTRHRIDEVTQQLEDEGVEKFNKPFEKLMETLAKRSSRQVTGECHESKPLCRKAGRRIDAGERTQTHHGLLYGGA